jgi:predicted nicotinamide N-methyase
MHMKTPTPLISYDTIQTIEKVVSTPIHIVALRNLDRTLDQICELYAPKNSEESDQLLRLCPYFGIIWPSARALSIFIDQRKSLFNKRSGIEVGSGLALPSLVAAKAGAKMRVTDFHPDVKWFISKNAELNRLNDSSAFVYQEWDWTSKTQNPEPFDFVLASDVLYERQHPDELAQSLAKLVKPKTANHPGGVIYLSDPGRVYLEVALAAIEALGFHRIEHRFEVEETSSSPEHRLEKKRTVFVFEFIQN